MPEEPDVRTIEERRADLDREVSRIRRAKDEGKLPRVESREELFARLNASEGIICLADAMKEVLPKLEAAAKEYEAFCDDMKSRLHSVDREVCLTHSSQLEFDIEYTLGRSWKADKLVIVYKPCPKCEEAKKKAASIAKWRLCGIPEKVLNASFESFITDGDQMKEDAVRKFRRMKSGFIMAIGLWGTGKSHLAASTIKAHGSGLFVTMNDLIAELRQTYSDNSGQDSMVERFRLTKVMVLDELIPDAKGADIPHLLYRILGYRHDHDLLTVITSNEPLDSCLAILGPKLMDRIREKYVVVNFPWESHRQKNARD